MKWTGLTGGIATGKSTAKKLLESLGVPVIDADQISHRLSSVGEPGYLKIVSHFGRQILKADQSLDRKKLGQLIFSEPQQKDALESILHPLIQKEVQAERLILEARGVSIGFYDVPLLFEKNLAPQFDQVVLVWCDPKTQLARLTLRSNFTTAEAELRIKNQMPLVDKVAASDYCLDNSGSVHELEIQVKKLLARL